jgi:hypothetical protein
MTVTEESRVRGIVVACPTAAGTLGRAAGIAVRHVPARPGKAEIDPLLDVHDHLIVAGTDADLAAVVLRLLRRERLSGVSVGFVPSTADSAVAALWGLPADPAGALESAVSGKVTAAPLIRDDKGGVLVGRGSFGTVRGEAYCDEQLAFRGAARSVDVTPAADGPGLAVRVVTGTLRKRATTWRGRAFQLGGISVRPVCDGVEYPRAVDRWTWYRHTEDLRLVR